MAYSTTMSVWFCRHEPASETNRRPGRHYGKLIGCTVVAVLWDQLGGEPLPVLVLSTPGGGNAECVVLNAPGAAAPGFLRHDI